MSKPIALILATAISLAPVGAPAGQTAVMGGGIAPPPQGSPGPGKGVIAPPDQGAAAPPRMVGQVPIPKPEPPVPLTSPNTKCTTLACQKGEP